MAEPLVIKGIPTMFGDIHERNVYFLVDTSGSMYRSIDTVKEHLIETLLKHAYSSKDAMFNIVEFNSEISQWADKLVNCTPDTVKIASNWINKLSAKTGTNTQDALLTAFSDPGCEAIYLVTDGLPDQHPEDILDHVSYASQNRPVHCVYLTGEQSDDAATEFLQDLAHETYGSFSIVTMTQHGCVDRIQPVYRSDLTEGRVIRTTDGALFPNDKFSTITTTLAADPFNTLGIAPEVLAPRVYLKDGIPFHYPFYGYNGLWPYHYPYDYRPRFASSHAWSRYRPSKAWLQEQKKVIDTSNNIAFSPAAGALLIGQEVLARRKEDGFYYLGKVKSQIMSDKFLVELGPTKHGKYVDTVYQETFVYDIISKIDAMRHSIIAGDKVLAPWEPEGERYCPGVVLQGSEKRQADGGGEDSELSVSFVNARSAKVPRKTAVWIPLALHERITFELSMPKDARESLQSQESYPESNLPGYPTTEIKRDPGIYTGPQPVTLGPANLIYDHGQYYHPDYVPIYPVYHKHQEKKSAVKAADIDKLVPGTSLTEKELNEKVMSQIMKHKIKLEDKKDRLERDIRLLRRQKMQKENSFKKSVEFDLSHTDLEDDLGYYDLENQDSGCGLSYNSDPFIPEMEDMSTQTTRDYGTNTDTRLFYKKRKNEKRLPWKYWHSDPSPSMMEPASYEPFRETALQAPLEVRDTKMGPYGVEWSDSAFGYADPNARSTYDRQVLQKMLHEPHPPASAKQVTSKEVMATSEVPRELRGEFRRRRIIERQKGWTEKLDHEHGTRHIMADQHRANVQQQIERENRHRIQENQQIECAREAKRQMQSEMRQKLQQYDNDKEGRKFEALKLQQSRREQTRAEHLRQSEEQSKLRQEAKTMRAQQRWDEVHQRLQTEESQTAARDQQHRNAKINRIEHFRKLENEGQKRKDLRVGVADQHLALYRSQVLA